MTGLSAFVVAGGKSSRMGIDKAFLELGGESLLARALRLAGSVSSDVFIVGDPVKFSRFGRTIADIFPGSGPLAGIHAALRSSETELNLMLAIDTPFLASEFLTYVMQQAQASGAMVTVPRAQGRFQPLCAAYRPEFAGIAEEALSAGRNKIGPLLTPERTRVVTQEEIERLAFPVSMFDNLNTSEDMERARAAIRQR